MRDRRIYGAIFLTLHLLTVSCSTLRDHANPFASELKEFASEAEFRSWFAFYYKDPNPQDVTEALKYMRQQNYLKDYPDVAAAFISKIFEKTPEQLDDWMTEWATLGPETWDVVLAGLYFANTDKTRALFAKHIDRGSLNNRNKYQTLVHEDRQQADLLALEIIAPRQINILWAAYSASGDERFVKKVIGLIRNYGDRNQRLAAIGEAAIITLANSAVIHEAVATICVEENRTNPDPKTRTLISTMLRLIAELSQDEDLPAH